MLDINLMVLCSYSHWKMFRFSDNNDFLVYFFHMHLFLEYFFAFVFIIISISVYSWFCFLLLSFEIIYFPLFIVNLLKMVKARTYNFLLQSQKTIEKWVNKCSSFIIFILCNHIIPTGIPNIQFKFMVSRFSVIN